MTEEEFNKVTKELDVVLLDVNYKNFETPLDVARVCLTLEKINERFLAEENEKLEKENAELKAKYSEHIRDSHDNYFAMCKEKDDDFDKMKNKLEKENAELKEFIRLNEEDYRKTLEHYLSEINELEKENAEKEKALKTMANLNADNVVEIDKLKAQIEKMANCTNCSNFDGDNYCKKDKKIIHRLNGNCSMWELAE